jgi:hypothetical protein
MANRAGHPLPDVDALSSATITIERLGHMTHCGDTIGSPSPTCQCWAPVLGTMLILFGVFNLVFGIALATASIELSMAANEVASSGELIRIGSTMNQFSGGLLHFGDAEQGEAVKKVLDLIPPTWLSLVLAIGRVLLSAAAIVLGAFLARRNGRILPLLGKWGLVAGVWGVVAMLVSISTYRFLGITTGGFAATVTIGLDLAMHVVWPGIIVWKVRAEGFILIGHASNNH